jgi:DNA-binding MarR family transcriptional regulator
MKRLLDDGLVEEAPRPEDAVAQRGAYYRLTPLGRRVLVAESRRLSDLVAHMREARLAPESSR